MARKYDVFISHAGEDKAPLAVLIYEGLKRRGISAFLDERELRVAGDAVKEMDEAMRTALIGLFILSPEFALKAYPMLEVDCFLKRAGLLGEGGQGGSADRPELIPIFYRLNVAGCKYAAAFEELECDQIVRDRFNESVKRGETSLEKVLERLRILAGRTGVENKTGIGNDDTEEMKGRRQRLAEKICDEVTRVLVGRARKSGLDSARIHKVEDRFGEVLRPTFAAPKNPKETILDFSSALQDGKAQTCEAQVLREVLQSHGGTRVVALIGGGGVGKSCTVRGVARHELVRERFPGGVYFMSLGMDASSDTVRLELLRILRAAGGKRLAEGLRDEKSTEVISGEVGKLLKRGRSLLVLDDVWERGGVKAKIVSEVSDLFSDEHGGVVVLTTRSASVASRGDVIVHVEPREAVSEVTRNILLRYAKFTVEEIEKEGVGWVLEKLQEMSGGLLVCLAVIGRGVRKLAVQVRGNKGRAWKAYFEKVRSCGEALLRGEVDDYKGLRKSLLVALQVLEESDETRIEDGRYAWSVLYRSLCVMKKQTIIPVRALEGMWKMNHSSQVLIALEGLSSVGLGEIVFESDELKGLRVHDLLHEFAVSLARDAEGVVEWHKRLLNGYICSRGDHVREWWSLDDDGYVYGNVCRHLRDGGISGELVTLLLTVQWTNARLGNGGLPKWKEDFYYCLEAKEREGEEENTEEKRNGLKSVRDAVAESWVFLAPDEREQLAFQMYGRLQGAKDWPARKYLESVKQWQTKLWLKPDRDCWTRSQNGISGEIPLRADVPVAVAIHGKPLCAVVGTTTGVLVFISLEEKRVVRRWVGHKDSIQQVAFSPDGRLIYSYSLDGIVRRWCAKTGIRVEHAMLKDESSQSGKRGIWDLCQVAFTSDCKALVGGSEGGEVNVWDLGSGEKVGESMRGFECGVRCVTISAEGNRVAAGGEDGSLRMWNRSVPPQEVWHVGNGHYGAVTCITFSPDGCFVVSGSEDGTLRLWNANTGGQIGNPLLGNEWTVMCVAVSSDSKRVVSGGDDCTVRVWDVENGEQLGTVFRGHAFYSHVAAVALSGDGRFAVSAGDGCVRVWDLQESPRRKDDRSAQDSIVSCLAASFDYSLYVSAHYCFEPHTGCTMRVWDSRSGKQIGESVPLGKSLVSFITASPDNRHFACGMLDGTMQIWDVVSRAQVGNVLCGHTDMINSISYSPDGQWIVSGSQDETVRVWSAETYAQVGAKEMVMRVGVKRRWDSDQGTASDTGTRKQLVCEHDGAVTCVAFSADGKMIISGADTGKIYVWEVKSGELVACAKSDHEGTVTRIDTARDHIRCLNWQGREMRWRLEQASGLIAISDVHDGREVAESDGEGKGVFPGDNLVLCVDRYVRLGVNGPVVASLPADVRYNGWQYDSSRGVLVTGHGDGQVLFSRFVDARAGKGCGT